jgi:hypothetical protein
MAGDHHLASTEIIAKARKAIRITFIPTVAESCHNLVFDGRSRGSHGLLSQR